MNGKINSKKEKNALKNLKFMTFGEDKDKLYEEDKYLTSSEIDNMLYNNEGNKEVEHKAIRKELQRQGLSEEEIDSVVAEIYSNDSHIQEIHIGAKEKKEIGNKELKEEILQYLLEKVTKYENIKIEVEKKGKLSIKIEIE